MTGQTVAVPPRPRGEIQDADVARIKQALTAADDAQTGIEQAVLAAIANGATVRAITAATGIAGSTIQRYVNRGRRPDF